MRKFCLCKTGRISLHLFFNMDIKILCTGPMRVNTLIVPLIRNFVLVFDSACCHFSFDTNFLTDFLKKNSLVPVAIVQTHGHFDHVAGLKSLRHDFPNAPILIHKNDSDLIGPNSEIEQKKQLWQMNFYDFLPSVSDLPAADSFLEDKKTLFECLKIFWQKKEKFNLNQKSESEIKINFDDKTGEIQKSLCEWKILHTPGHTKGSCCFYNVPQKILISGDTLFYRNCGRTDLPGGSDEEMRESLKKIFENIPAETKVFPGHGESGFLLKENF